MPIVHAPAGSPKGGQFAPGGNQAPTTSGTPKQQAAERKYYRALAGKKKKDQANVSKYLHALAKSKKQKAAAAKKAAATALKAKRAAASKATARQRYLAQKPIIAKGGHYKPPAPGTGTGKKP